MAQRIALVTGGMGGLGEAICVKLEKMGLNVVVTYSPGNTKYKDWLKEMEGAGHKFHAYPCDVSDFDSCQKMIAAVAKDLGQSTSSSTTPASPAT
jgi:acetoacetyl-CoA reductase